HDLSRQARLCRSHCAGLLVPGRGAGYPGYGAGVRGGPEYRPALVSRSSRPAPAFSRHVLHDVRVRQVHLDELLALPSAVKDGSVYQTIWRRCARRSCDMEYANASNSLFMASSSGVRLASSALSWRIAPSVRLRSVMSLFVARTATGRSCSSRTKDHR